MLRVFARCMAQKELFSEHDGFFSELWDIFRRKVNFPKGPPLVVYEFLNRKKRFQHQGTVRYFVTEKILIWVLWFLVIKSAVVKFFYVCLENQSKTKLFEVQRVPSSCFSSVLLN